MKTKYILAVLIIGLLTCGCDKTIEFNGEITNPMLVVSSFITPDSAIKAELTKSRFFLEEDFGSYEGFGYEKVTNADFSLYVNGMLKGKLTHIGSGIYESGYKPSPGEEIKIEVSAPGFASVSGTSVLPAKPLILKVDTSSVTEKQYYIGYIGGYGGISEQDTLSEYTYKKVSFRIKFKDEGNKKNYYRLMVRKRTYYEYSFMDTYLSNFEDIVFGNQQTNDIGSLFEFSRNNYNYDTFSDDLFNGKEYELKFSSYIVVDQKDYNGYDSQYRKEVRSTFNIYLQQISPDYYLYARSSGAAKNLSGNPFVEPIQIHSNIINGIGVLGSYTSSAAAVVDVRN